MLHYTPIMSGFKTYAEALEWVQGNIAELETKYPGNGFEVVPQDNGTFTVYTISKK